MEKLEGYVERIKYRSDENGYTVFVLTSGDKEVTCVGYFTMINNGEYYEMTGTYTRHEIYGDQFKVSVANVGTPKTSWAMEKYLGSGAIKGVGAAMAKKIVDEFGADTFKVIDEHPERLSVIKGITEKKALDIYKQFEEKRDIRDTMMYLQQFGISSNFSLKIYNQYGKRTREVISENPYRLAEDIKGIGFNTADNIAKQCGYGVNSDFRINAGIVYCLKENSYTLGHAYIPSDLLCKTVAGYLWSDAGMVAENIKKLTEEKKLIKKAVADVERIYLPQYYYTELSIARMLHDLDVKDSISENLMEKRLSKVEAKLSITLDELQKDALRSAMLNALMVITGGPGTGKTTTINALIELFSEDGAEIILTAPTGRAAKRMSEATGREARTIHRLLEFLPEKGLEDDDTRLRFQRNAENPLEADVIIVDEASMIDMNLMKSLLTAIPVGTRVIFVGDVRQLPSVGPGNVLEDIIKSGCFEVIRLNKIFRQDEESAIVVNAHKIDIGEHMPLDDRSKEFAFQVSLKPETAVKIVIDMVKTILPRETKADSYEIQVLSPTKIGTLGTVNLNRELQASLNPASEEKKETKVGDDIFREGDKVMQVKNDYQLEWKSYNRFGICVDGGMGVFNGDTGVIKEINLFSELVTVLFDGEREVEYTFSQLDELMLAYAVTVHKSQGSEYPAVVIPLMNVSPNLSYRNLLYTAVTRASKCVRLVGNKDTVYKMIDNDKEHKRYTGLADAIREIC